MSYIIPKQGVVQSKLAPRTVSSTVSAGGFAKSASSSGNFGTTSSTYTNVTNLTVTITTTGRPIFIGLYADSTGSPCVEIDPNESCFFGFNDGTSVFSSPFFASNTSSGNPLPIPCSSVWTYAFKSAGTYTFTLQVKTGSGVGSVQVRNSFLIAYEI